MSRRTRCPADIVGQACDIHGAKMRLRNITGSEEIITENEYVISNLENRKGKWGVFFGNNHPIRIEVGMGKGKFISEMARQNLDVNFIGIEKYASVLVRALGKREADLNNLYYVCIDASVLPEIFEKGEVDTIYLNFCDPWPKERHAKRRLTSRQFFEKYNKILKKDGKVEFKTDNTGLFEFSLEEVEEAGWNLDMHTFDLHNDSEMAVGNVTSEYEEKFSGLGNPIYKLVASRCGNANSRTGRVG